MLEPILVDGAELHYNENFLSPADGAQFLKLLIDHCAWTRQRTSFGTPVPRDEAYYGDPGTEYTYSRRQYVPLAWLPELLTLKERVESETLSIVSLAPQLRSPVYNAVLCNLYRNGQDSVGLHADAEPEMGPVIASVSLGAARRFRLKRKDGSVAFSQSLPNGSLLIMAGKTQQNFKHEVPKEPGVTAPRVNLTFRHIRQP